MAVPCRCTAVSSATVLLGVGFLFCNVAVCLVAQSHRYTCRECQGRLSVRVYVGSVLDALAQRRAGYRYWQRTAVLVHRVLGIRRPYAGGFPREFLVVLATMPAIWRGRLARDAAREGEGIHRG